jgi:hypothetical protein
VAILVSPRINSWKPSRPNLTRYPPSSLVTGSFLPTQPSAAREAASPSASDAVSRGGSTRTSRNADQSMAVGLTALPEIEFEQSDQTSSSPPRGGKGG